MDQNWEAAMFQELSFSPATIEATKTVDLYGMIDGHVCEQADAVQAYTHADPHLFGCPVRSGRIRGST